MFQLIKKDLFIQKKMVKLSILYLIFFTLLFSKNEMIGFTIGVFAVTYILTAGAFSIDEKNKSDRLLLSMPIKRSTIVLQKYISTYLYAGGAVFLTYFLYILMKLFEIPLHEDTLSVENIFIVAAIVTFYAAFTYPFVFKYGYMRSRFIQMIVFFVLILIGMPVIDTIMNETGANSVKILFSFIYEASIIWQSVVLIILLTLITACSYYLSLSFYRKKEY